MNQRLQNFLDAERNRRIEQLAELGAFTWKPNPLPLCLIAQIQRSGGTLLTRLLDGHPGLRVYPHELYWHPTDETQWPTIQPATLAPGEVFDALAALQVRLLERFSEAGYNKFGRSRQGEPLPFVFNLALQRRLFVESVAPLQTRREALDLYLDTFFGAWLDYRDRYLPGKSMTVAFGKRHNLEPTASAFGADYPDGTMITVVRRPDNWLTSATAHRSDQYGDPSAAISQWIESASASLRLAADGRALLTTFERLVQSPEGELARICNWLSIPTPTTTEPTFNSLSVHSNSAFAPVRGIDPAVADRVNLETWRSLGQNERSLAEGLYGEVVAHIGEA